MTSEKILALKKLKELWVILKDEEKPKVDKRSAIREVIKIQEELVKSDPTFEAYDLTMSKYAEFLPIEYRSNSKVKWGELDDYLDAKFLKAVAFVQKMEAYAVQVTRELLPTEPVDSQKFGMIVSAKTEKLLSAYYFQNS
jgi:hypothetical protein